MIWTIKWWLNIIMDQLDTIKSQKMKTARKRTKDAQNIQTIEHTSNCEGWPPLGHIFQNLSTVSPLRVPLNTCPARVISFFFTQTSNSITFRARIPNFYHIDRERPPILYETSHTSLPLISYNSSNFTIIER